MPLTSTDIDTIATCLSSSTQLRAGIAEARSRYPGLSFTCCEATDMASEEPYQVYAAFDLYLVDGSGHCWQLTGDPHTATGILLAEHRHA